MLTSLKKIKINVDLFQQKEKEKLQRKLQRNDRREEETWGKFREKNGVEVRVGVPMKKSGCSEASNAEQDISRRIENRTLNLAIGR